VTTFEKLPN
jgi:hypothetical protein